MDTGRMTLARFLAIKRDFGKRVKERIRYMYSMRGVWFHILSNLYHIPIALLFDRPSRAGWGISRFRCCRYRVDGEDLHFMSNTHVTTEDLYIKSWLPTPTHFDVEDVGYSC